MPAELDVHEELAGAKVGPVHRMLGLLIALMTLFDGYDTFNPAYVIHYVAKPWDLSAGQAGFLVSSGLIGFLIGAAGQGAVSDRLGRRVTLLAGLWVVNVFTVLTPLFGTNPVAFCTLRVLTGIGLGMLLPWLLSLWWGLGGLTVIALIFLGGHGVNFVCVAAAGFLTIGAQHVLNNFTVASYDTGIRASGVGMELGVGRVGAILGPLVAGMLQGATGGPDAMFWAIGAAGLAAAACIASLGAGRTPALAGDGLFAEAEHA